MTKQLDKMTKAELLAKLLHTQETLRCFDVQLVERTADVKRLTAQLKALDDRRRFEAQAYRAKIKRSDAKSTHTVNWGTVAKDYCAEHGVASVSKAQLEDYLAAKTN